MIECMTWKVRPLSPEQSKRMLDVWGKLEAAMAEDTTQERLCWYLYSDGTGGMSVMKVHDPDGFAAFQAEIGLALGEFVEFDSHMGLDLEKAMPAILRAVERAAA